MPSKIWYVTQNQKPYEVLPGVVQISEDDYLPMLDVVQQCIDLFNQNIEWDGMWDLSEAIKRFKEGAKLFVWYGPESNIIGYYWIAKNYIYNVYIHPSRPDNKSVKFLHTGFNFIDQPAFTLYCDDWNIQAQKFFEKAGFKKI